VSRARSFGVVVAVVTSLGARVAPVTLVALVAPVTLGACDRTPNKRPSSSREEEAPEAPKTAAQVYSDRCAACHGKEGKGDGATAPTLNPRPRSFADPEWQASVSDETLRKVIIGGGPAIGKSPLMPANPDFANANADANADVVGGLITVIRAFNRPLRKP
jgi:mono/diheme cytochrome c family protein